jgi:hypothetical protein
VLTVQYAPETSERISRHGRAFAAAIHPQLPSAKAQQKAMSRRIRLGQRQLADRSRQQSRSETPGCASAPCRSRNLQPPGHRRVSSPGDLAARHPRSIVEILGPLELHCLVRRTAIKDAGK